MSDSTYSVKVEEETRDRVKRLQEEAGISSKEFFKLLLEQHEVARLQEAGTRHKELATLQHHLARIEGIFVAVVNDGKDRLDAAGESITELTQARTEAEAALTQLRTEHAQRMKELAAERDQLAAAHAQADKDKSHYERLADLSQASEASLKDRVAELELEVKDFPDERNGYLAEVAALEEKAASLNDQLADMQGDLKRGQHERDTEKRACSMEIDRLKKSHTEALNAMKEKSVLNIEAAVLEAREAAQKRLEDARAEDLTEIKRLLAINAALKDQVAELLRAENAALKDAKAKT